MRRGFPVLALLALILWVVALVALRSGRSSRTALIRAEWATLAVHVGAIAWFQVIRPRSLPPTVPDWAGVQAAKHRRKGVYLAAWGLAVLGLGWWATRAEPPSTEWPGRAVWFGAALNLGFQPGMFVAEWLTIAAQTRLVRLVWSQEPVGSAEGREL